MSSILLWKPSVIPFLTVVCALARTVRAAWLAKRSAAVRAASPATALAGLSVLCTERTHSTLVAGAVNVEEGEGELVRSRDPDSRPKPNPRRSSRTFSVETIGLGEFVAAIVTLAPDGRAAVGARDIGVKLSGGLVYGEAANLASGVNGAGEHQHAFIFGSGISRAQPRGTFRPPDPWRRKSPKAICLRCHARPRLPSGIP
jgi:hypothetical protein